MHGTRVTTKRALHVGVAKNVLYRFSQLSGNCKQL